MLSTRKLIRTIIFGYLLFFAKAFVMASSGNKEEKGIRPLAIEGSALEEEKTFSFSDSFAPTEKEISVIRYKLSKQGIAFASTEEFKTVFHQYSDPLLLLIVLEDEASSLETLLETGLINVYELVEGETFLWHVILSNGAAQSARVFIENGLDINHREFPFSGGDALCRSIEEGRTKMVDVLVKAGADVNFSDIAPLYLNCWKNSDEVAVEIAKILIGAGARVDDRTLDELAKTPLEVAIKDNKKKLVTYLLDSGADVNLPDEYGIAPLHLAATKNLLEIGKLLLERGADPHAKTEYEAVRYEERRESGMQAERYTPEDIARRAGHDAFVDMLRKHEEETENGSLLLGIGVLCSFCVILFGVVLKRSEDFLGSRIISGFIHQRRRNKEKKRLQPVARYLKTEDLSDVTKSLFKSKWEDKEDDFFSLSLDFPKSVSDDVCEISIDTFFCKEKHAPYVKLQDANIKKISIKKQILIDEVKQSFGRLFGNSNVSIIEDSSKTNSISKIMKLFIETGVDGFDKNKKKKIETEKISLLEKIIQHSFEYKNIEEKEKLKRQQEKFREKISSTKKEIQVLRDELNILRNNKPADFARFENRALSVLASIHRMNRLDRDNKKVKEKAETILKTVGSETREKIINECEEILKNLEQKLKVFSNNLKKQEIQKNSRLIDEKFNVVKRRMLDLGEPSSEKQGELKRYEKFLKKMGREKKERWNDRKRTRIAEEGIRRKKENCERGKSS